MLSVIKTAIMTIILSFISGVLLDTYKNFAPKILCTMSKGETVRLNDRVFKIYTITIRNISNKIINNLNLNVQNDYHDLRLKDSQITTGLKFEVSEQNNVYDVSIPFLSKNDEFSTRILVEDNDQVDNKPVLALRSREKFKKIYKEVKEEKNTAASLNADYDKPKRKDKNNKKANSSKKSFFMHKRVIAAIVVVLAVVYAGISGAEYINKSADASSNGTSNTEEQPATGEDSSKSNASDTTNKNAASQNNGGSSSNNKTSNTQKNSSADTKQSSSKSENDTKSANTESDKKENTKTNTGSTSADESKKNDTQTSKTSSDKNTDAKSSDTTKASNSTADDTAKNSNAKTSASSNEGKSQNTSEGNAGQQ